MKLAECKENVNYPLRQATLCFLIKEGEVLLAMKKRGFGQGRWNGVGGKRHDEEEIENTAEREAKEEIGVVPLTLEKVATLDFYFPHRPEWNQQVVVYLSSSWSGEPTESEEMAPYWYKFEALPFDSMWPADIFWLPQVLAGKKVKAEFMFGENDTILDKNVVEV